MAAAFPPIEELLPHRGQALLLQSVLDWSVRAATCGVTLTDAFPYARDGRIEALCGLELLAQSVAVYSALARRAAENLPSEAVGPRAGLLVGVPRAEFFTAHLPVGIPLRAHVEPLWQRDGAGRFRGELNDGTSALLRAELTVVEQPRDEFGQARPGRPSP